MDTSKIKTLANVAKDSLKENSPKILLGVGIITGIAALAYTVKQTLTVDEILEDHKERVNDIKMANAEITDKEYKSGLFREYIRTCGYLAKHYRIPALLAATSGLSTYGAFGMINGRLVSAEATAAAAYAKFSDYRANVVERFGEEVDYELANNIIEETVEEETVDENGKKKKTKEKVKIAKSSEPGMFSFFLGKDYYKYWDENLTDEQNIVEMKMRLAGAISNTNRDVYNNGYVWFDEIAKRVGIEVTDIFRTAAVVYDLDNFDEKDQFSINRNIKIRDAHILEGGEKVILVEITGVDPNFKIKNFDKDKFFKDKAAYKEYKESIA